jgi:hypothetical protein
LRADILDRGAGGCQLVVEVLTVAVSLGAAHAVGNAVAKGQDLELEALGECLCILFSGYAKCIACAVSLLPAILLKNTYSSRPPIWRRINLASSCRRH